MLIEASDGECQAAATVYVGVDPPAAEPVGQAAGEGGAPPRTDGLSSTTDEGRPLGLWLVAGLLMGLGIGGRYASRPSRSR
jgi:hypothetical protein